MSSGATAADATAAIDVADVHRSLPLGATMVDVLRGVTFSVAAGSWVALTGPSGCGKSTLLGLVAGLDSPDRGSIRIAGTDITTLPESRLAGIRNRRIGIVFQAFNLISTLTAQENVEAPLWAGPRRRESRALAGAMLERVGLSDRAHHRPHQLSGGQQQRVAIARALVTSPVLLVADEPTGNLDSAAGAQILDLFAALRADLGVTIFVVTHDDAVAARSDRILHMIDGRLVSDSARAA